MGNAQSSLDLTSSFGDSISFVLQGVARAAESIVHSPAYLVGGAVRDALLGTPSADLDIMLEGDALLFVRKLRADWREYFPELEPPKKPILFKKYGTAKLPFATPLFGVIESLDFASARAEQYPTPGQAPVIRQGDLADDLGRRDFSINALAVNLLTEEIVDLFSGIEHLRQGILAILHSQSFRDDPARLLRACRFASRLKMNFDTETETCFCEGVDGFFLQTLPPRRKFDEFRKLLADSAADESLRYLKERDLLTQIHSDFSIPAMYDSELARLQSTTEGVPHWQLRFLLLAAELREVEFRALCGEFKLSSKETETLCPILQRAT